MPKKIKQKPENPNKHLLSLLIILLFSSALLAVKMLASEIYPLPEENAFSFSAKKHGITAKQYLERSAILHDKLDVLAAQTAIAPTTAQTDDCKAQMNQADFNALAALGRDITCAGTTAPTVRLTQNIVLSPSQVFRIFLGSVDSDGVTTHSTTFDCQGHSIAHSGYTFTLYYTSQLQNCTIIRPTRGIWALSESTVINTVVKNPSEYGVVANQNATLTDVTVRSDMPLGNTVGSGFALLGDSRGTRLTATSDINKSKLYWGFEVADKSIVSDITSTRNVYGVRLEDGAIITRGRASGNASEGFWMGPAPAQPQWFGIAPVCDACIAEYNGGQGFSAYGRIGSQYDQAISIIKNSAATSNTFNGYLIFHGAKVLNSKATNNGTNVNDINGGFWPEDQAHFGFRLDQYDNPQSYGVVSNITSVGNKNGILIMSAFQIDSGRICDNTSKDIYLKTGGTLVGSITTSKIVNEGGTSTAILNSCTFTGSGGKPPLIEG